MTKDDTKRPMTPAELRLLANAKAAAEKKFGKGSVIVSATITAADGTKQELAIDPAMPAAGADPNVELVESNDGSLSLQKLPPKHLRDSAHQLVGELLHELQQLYAQGELKCLAVVWTDQEGTSCPAVAGLLIGESLPACLKDLAETVLENADVTEETEGTDLQ